MKKLLFTSLLFVQSFSFAQITYNLSGHAYLGDQADHSSLQFSVINPQNLDTLAYGSPDSNGYYSLDVSPGFYLLNWSHTGHIPQELGNFAFSSDTVLADINLLSGYVQEVCGDVAGLWATGSVYDVTCDVEVPWGATLTIEPGVRVRFMEGTGMTCYGVLDVLGDSIHSVLFTSREASPLPGDWGNVSLYAQGNTISHLDYEYATDGFTGNNISYSTIDNVSMLGNLSLSANGMYFTNSSDLTITNNTISVGGEYGIHSYESDNSVVNNNTITGQYNTTIEMGDCDNCDFEGNTLTGSRVLQLEYSDNLDIHNNQILDHSSGFYLNYCDSAQITFNEMTKPTSSMFGDYLHCLIYNSDSSSALIIQGNVFSLEDGNRQDTWYEGLIRADQSEITGNTYNANTNRDVYGVFIYANESVISDNTYSLVSLGGESSPSFLQTQGNEDNRSIVENNTISVSKSYPSYRSYVNLGGYTDFTNNTIDIDVRESWGSSSIILSRGEGNTISDNSIVNSQKGPAVYFENATNQILTNNEIQSTRGSSVIKTSNADVLISYNMIKTQVRGIEMSSQSGGEVSNNTIVSSGSPDYGIHISNLTMPVVQNNIIQGFVNGIYAENDLKNQFIQNNNLWDISGDLFSGTAMPALIGEMIDVNNNGDVCDIYSNMNVDPLFVNANFSNYSLQEQSPCINAGHEGSALDPDGTIADIGALYYPKFVVVTGCTDSLAFNFDELANQDDGSCEHNCMPPANWTYQTTEVNQTLMITSDMTTDIMGSDLSYGSLIGVFYGNENGQMKCAGSTIYTGETTHIAIMGDDGSTEELDGFISGQDLHLRVWDTSSCQEFQVDAVFNGSSTFIADDVSVLLSIETSTVCQTINIPKGWSMISTYISADEIGVTSVFAPIVDDLIIVKDNSGNVYLPQYNYNSVEGFELGQGYQIKVASEKAIEICGVYANPKAHSIPLLSGWNMIGYLRLHSSNVESVLSDIKDSENLIIIKDSKGNPYLPEFEYNGLGDMNPGEGYQLKVHQADTLHFLSNNTQYRLSSSNVIENQTKHLMKVRPTDQNMTLVIEDEAWSEVPSEGSEIGVFNQEGLMVGSTQYTSPVTVMSIYGNDVLTDARDGMLSKEPMILKLWKDNTLQEMKITDWKSGSSNYQKDAIHVVGSVITNSEVEIITPIKRSLVKIVNVLGQEVSPQETLLKGIVYFEIYDDGSVEKIVK